LKHDIGAWRTCIIIDISDFVDEWEDETCLWFQNLAPHVQHAYWCNKSERAAQIPALMHILKRLNLPDWDTLSAELNLGFAMPGKLAPGAGWRMRTDNKYSFPITMKKLRT
jgi:hypothetical protein